jgi:hypothetical protein
MPAYNSTPYPNVEELEGWTELSPPAAYPSTMEHEANEGNFELKHHVYAIGYNSSVGQEHPSLSGVLY